VLVLHLCQSAILNRPAVAALGYAKDTPVSCTRHFLRELNRFGITSAIDGAGGSQQFPGSYAAVMQLARSGDLSVWGPLSGDDNVRGGPADSDVRGS
jgi:predicted amidohydrolase YtcJ